MTRTAATVAIVTVAVASAIVLCLFGVGFLDQRMAASRLIKTSEDYLRFMDEPAEGNSNG